jgi:hypothetical protein
MVRIERYAADGKYFRLTTNDINEHECELYLTDPSGNSIDFPSDTNLHFCIGSQKYMVEQRANKFIIHDDICYELQIGNVIWRVENEKKWDYSFIKYN